MRSYDHSTIEKKWQERWEREQLYKTPDSGAGTKNEYMLVEFPYPSGDLHIGHWYAFAVPDIYARFRRMQGANVLYPIGFDSFGLPAENAAIKRKVNPRTWTYDNIASMTAQLRSMGNSFDWSRKVVASDPEYYHWTQWLFLKLYEKGLAYKKKSTVPWCDSCKTVLANEQIVHGACERCGTEVTHKELDQWFFKITDYADRLLSDLESLDWPEEIKASQREWIGRSEGALLSFPVVITKNDVRGVTKQAVGDSGQFHQQGRGDGQALDVFTTRPDTLYGATYLVLAPEHGLVQSHRESIENWEDVAAYIEATKARKELERKEGKGKTGVELRGIKAVNPATQEEIPIWIADYVLASYGTGAIMAVPAHDERDWEFAHKYALPIRFVVTPENVSASTSQTGTHWTSCQGVWTAHGVLHDCGEFSGLRSEDAIKKITERVGGTMTTQYRLRDWLLSRQRYWGCPIPIVYDPEGKPRAVPDEHLPWRLPEDVDHTPTGEAPLARSSELRERTERIFGPGWTPEVDTMDTFVDSSWYFLRYLDPHNGQEFASKEKQVLWMPIHRYSGGAEHTTMHLLYSRFFYKALYDLGLVTHSEPYAHRMNRGLILGPDGRKMSKSKGNVINPDEHVQRVGADTVRMYLAFIGPYDEVGQYPWDLGGIVGIRRFLERVWGLREKVDVGQKAASNTQEGSGPTLHSLPPTTLVTLHKTIKKVGDDIVAFHFNTALSQLMVLSSALEKLTTIPQPVYETLVRLLAPFAPHLTEELWETLGHDTSVHREAWPAHEATILAQAKVVVAVQVNGKVRATCEVERGMPEPALIAHARELPAVAARLAGQSIVRIVAVPDRLVNFVIKIDVEDVET